MRREAVLHAAGLAALVAAPLWLSPYHVSLLGRFLAMSILAIGLAVAWGWGGFLSLGQGVFFGLGGYLIAMHLKLAALPPGELPDFMTWSGLDRLPWWWAPFRHPLVAVAGVLVLPALAAGLVAWLVFHRRVRGVYFALLTQALALAFSTWLVSEQAYSGGFNGLTNYGPLFGLHLTGETGQLTLYWSSVGVLAASYALAAWLGRTRFGRLLLAIRDGENRVRFLGYDTMPYKVAAFALAGGLAGIAGALYTMQVGVISPDMIGVVPSIEMIVWVAVGGRESLAGAVLGCLAVNFAKDWISSAAPALWLFILGALFVAVVILLPRGLAGLMPEPQKAILESEAPALAPELVEP